MVVPMTNEPNRDDSKQDKELRLLYELSVGEIACFKPQQWNATNYAVLLYSGLIGVAWQLETLVCWKSLLLFSFAFVTASFVWFVLGELQASIKERRGRLNRIRTDFTDAFNSARGKKDEENEGLVF